MLDENEKERLNNNLTAMVNKKPIVELINIRKTFGSFVALDEINLFLREGEIHCFAGENGCGKSTLVKIISGAYTPDSGEIVINGKSYKEVTPSLSIDEGIQVIYQDLSLFDHMTVAENIAIGNLRQNNTKFIDWKRIHEIATEQLNKIGVDLNPNTPLRDISIGNKQAVAICRALAMNAKVLFMDEPTTALTNKEVDRLIKIMSDLRDSGLSIVFISHKLDEVFRISDVVSVFRDGKKIGDFPKGDLNPKRLAYYMTGKEVSYPKYVKDLNVNKKAIELKKLTKKGMFKDISLSVNQGDIIGFIGLLGSGRTELALSLFGLNKADSGEVIIDDKKVNITSPDIAMKHGIALLPEDRGTQGLFLNREIYVNVSSTTIDNFCDSLGVVDKNKEQQLGIDYINSLNIKTTSEFKLSGQLSGGNQQKVVLSKWLETNPRLFIMDNPTVGIDIGSKAEIYEIAQDLAKKGTAILLLSDELEELISNCNKIAIMHQGEIIQVLDEKDLEKENIRNLINIAVATGKAIDFKE